MLVTNVFTKKRILNWLVVNCLNTMEHMIIDFMPYSFIGEYPSGFQKEPVGWSDKEPSWKLSSISCLEKSHLGLFCFTFFENCFFFFKKTRIRKNKKNKKNKEKIFSSFFL